jgi:hypothetical protein
MTGKKYSKANVAKFCELISLGNSEATACSQVGISLEIFEEWLLHKPRFARAYEKAKSDVRVLLTAKLLKHTERDPRAAQYLHERVHPDYRRNGRQAAEAEPAKLTEAEHAESSVRFSE